MLPWISHLLLGILDILPFLYLLWLSLVTASVPFLPDKQWLFVSECHLGLFLPEPHLALLLESKTHLAQRPWLGAVDGSCIPLSTEHWRVSLRYPFTSKLTCAVSVLHRTQSWLGQYGGTFWFYICGYCPSLIKSLADSRSFDVLMKMSSSGKRQIFLWNGTIGLGLSLAPASGNRNVCELFFTWFHYAFRCKWWWREGSK